ncbi:MAG: hypothetical protein HWE30_02370 [Methylocystaceae bacterium]|nr:hypothetical protein [Methylocystaceae bacterium]
MPFPRPKGFKINLTPATPSLLDATSLKKQLENVGLNCSQLTPENLDGYIQNVKEDMPQGTLQAYAILAPKGELEGAVSEEPVADKKRSVQDIIGDLVTAATAEWKEDETIGYQGPLQVIQAWEHYNWLYENRDTNGFTGNISGPTTISQNETNEKAVQKLFSEVLIMMASSVVQGIDTASLQATVSNIVQEQTKDSVNYTSKGSRVIHLVDGYNSKGEANAIGTVTMTWTLTVEDYKRKTKDGGDKHDSSIDVKAWSVMYTDPSTLCANYNAVLDHFDIHDPSNPKCDA